MSSRVYIFLFLISILVGACRTDDTEIIRINPQTFNAKDEAAIGRRLVAESWRNENINRITPDNGEFTDGAFFYLRPLLNGILEQPFVTRRDSFDWEIHLVLDNTPHAYTLPGGQIIMHTALLRQLKNEAECVGIIAREVALAEIGAPMDALDRQVEDNVILGDLILGNLVPLDDIVENLPNLRYTEEEMLVADSLVSRLVCNSDYDELGLIDAVSAFPAANRYNLTHPSDRNWVNTFRSRVSECPGADSLYQQRYQSVLSRHVPQ